MFHRADMLVLKKQKPSESVRLVDIAVGVVRVSGVLMLLVPLVAVAC